MTEGMTMRNICFDTETTGFNFIDDRIIELAYIIEENGNIIERYDQFIKIDFPIPEAAKAVNNISDMMLKTFGIEEKQAAEAFMNALGDGNVTVTAHNCQFDLSFIYNMLIRYYKKEDVDLLFKKVKWIDSLTILRDRKVFPHKLSDGIEYYNIQNVVNSHRAIDDTEALYYLLQAAGLRSAAGNREHVHAEGVLQARFLVQQVLEVLDVRVLPEFQDYPDALLGGLVGDVDYVGGLARLDQVGHVSQELADVHADHRIGYLCDDKVYLAALNLLFLDASPDLDLAGACLIYVLQLVFVDDDAARREIGTLDVAHELSRGQVGILHVCLQRVYDLTKIVGRRGGGHADRYTLGTVDQEIRDAHGQDRGFLFRLVKVGNKIHRILVDV